MAPFKPRVVFDFDGVLHEHKHSWTTPDDVRGGPTPGAQEAVKAMIDAGIEVVVHTTRVTAKDEGNPKFRCDPEGAKAAVKLWLKEHGFPPLEVTAEKPAALLYIDDRAYAFQGDNWPTPEFVRRFRPWNRREYAGRKERKREDLKRYIRHLRTELQSLRDNSHDEELLIELFDALEDYGL